MLKVFVNGCNGKMGNVVCNLVEENENMLDSYSAKLAMENLAKKRNPLRFLFAFSLLMLYSEIECYPPRMRNA